MNCRVVLCFSRVALVAALSFAPRPQAQQTPAPALTRTVDPATEKRVDDLLKQMTLDEKIDLIGGQNPFRMHGVARLGIPALQMADGPVGAHIPAPTIAYAGGIGMAASWDRGLAKDIGVQLGRDARSRGAAFLLGPGVNIYRAPMNGRNFEYFGEDPFLASAMTVGYIEGVQSQGVSATVKHYLGNNSEYGRHTTDSVIGERALREIYEPSFEAAVKQAHVGAIMDAYNLTNGEHMTQNRRLNVDVAKLDWGFPGVIMSDWNAVYDTTQAFNAGLDLEMPFALYFSRTKIHAALDSGQVTVGTLDDKVRRILRVAVAFGWLDRPQFDPLIPRYNLDGKAVSRRAVLEGSVLLTNQPGTLPLREAEIHRLALIGPNAALTQTTGGGSGEVVSFAPTSLLVGLSNRLAGHADVLYSRGLYTAAQLARLTHFTTDPEGNKDGVVRESFANGTLQGTATDTGVETAMMMTGTTRREPEEQEALALHSTLSTSIYDQKPTSQRYTGFYNAAESGDYLAFVQTERPFRMTVDDKVVFDNAVIPKQILSQMHVPLSAGVHRVVLELLGAGRTGGLRFALLAGLAPVKTLVDPQTLEVAAKADAVVLSVGFNNSSEAEGGDRGFDLPLGQDELIERVAALGKKTVVVLNAGGSVNVVPWKDKVGAILQAWYPGEDGGNAVAQLLFGEANPSGHLPISWESQLTDNPSYANYYPAPGTNRIEYREGIYVGYRGYDHLGRKPLFPFGFGLSYTTFAYSGLTVASHAPGTATLSFQVKNTGAVAGATVAQVYVSPPAKSDRPDKELKGFDRVMLQPGESHTVSVELTPRDFAFFNVKAGEWTVLPGEYKVRVGQSSADLALQGTVKVPKRMLLSTAQ
ncbi:MAG TPA: glycoside hydrolase family 3 C-terminal domain-containing protein [Acidobacteriaceae bacterium]|nr:glycoside hydrolase family 3 C-terminal domain-containing protein [Acidobacteriaceae bacterium]